MAAGIGILDPRSSMSKALQEVRWKKGPGEDDAAYRFFISDSAGQKQRVQATVRAAGSENAALDIICLMLAKHEQGATHDELIDFRDKLYAMVHAGESLPVSVLQSAVGNDSTTSQRTQAVLDRMLTEEAPSAAKAPPTYASGTEESSIKKGFLDNAKRPLYPKGSEQAAPKRWASS